jgi:hypothetical protein
VLPEIIQMVVETKKPIDKCMSLVARKKGLEGSPTAYFRREGFLDKYDVEGQVKAERK